MEAPKRLGKSYLSQREIRDMAKMSIFNETELLEISSAVRAIGIDEDAAMKVLTTLLIDFFSVKLIKDICHQLKMLYHKTTG